MPSCQKIVWFLICNQLTVVAKHVEGMRGRERSVELRERPGAATGWDCGERPGGAPAALEAAPQSQHFSPRHNKQQAPHRPACPVGHISSVTSHLVRVPTALSPTLFVAKFNIKSILTDGLLTIVRRSCFSLVISNNQQHYVFQITSFCFLLGLKA